MNTETTEKVDLVFTEAAPLPLDVLLKRLRPSTAAVYTGIWKNFDAFCLANGYDAIARPHDSVMAYIDAQLDSDLSPYTVSTRLTTLRSIYRKAAQAGLVDDAQAQKVQQIDPIGNLAKKENIARRRTDVTKDDVDMLLDAVDTSTLAGKRTRGFLMTLFGTGGRAAEIVNLRFADIAQLPDGTWRADVLGKTDPTPRPVRLPERAALYLLHVLLPAYTEVLGYEPEYCFLRFSNTALMPTPITTRSAHRLLQGAFEASGLKITTHEDGTVTGKYKRLGCHDARRWMINRILDVSADRSDDGKPDVHLAMVAAGHKDISTTMVYASEVQKSRRLSEIPELI
jgi:integrase